MLEIIMKETKEFLRDKSNVFSLYFLFCWFCTGTAAALIWQRKP